MAYHSYANVNASVRDASSGLARTWEETCTASIATSHKDVQPVPSPTNCPTSTSCTVLHVLRRTQGGPQNS